MTNLNLTEVKAMVAQLKKVDFASCEEYVTDLIDNYGYNSSEIFWLNMELSDLLTSQRKYEESFEILLQFVDLPYVHDEQIPEGEFNIGPRDKKLTCLEKMVHLANISTPCAKEKILDELEGWVPFRDNREIQDLILEVLQKNRMNSKMYSVPSGLEEASENIDCLIKWIQEGGGYTQSLEVRFFNDVYRGVFLTESASDTQVLSKIPRDYLITYERASEGALWKKCQELNLKFIAPKHTVLGLFLLEERQKENKSFWNYYIKSLPPNMNTMPIFYSQEQKDLLKGSPILRILNKRVEEMKKDYILIKENLEEFQDISYESFAYHRCLASSRVFGFIMHGNKTGGMVPFLDMINHKRPKQSLWGYDDISDSFQIEAYGDCAANSELFDSYGKKCNSRFLLNYGFIEEDNDANEFSFVIDFDSSFPLYKEKQDYSPQLNSHNFRFKLSKDFDSNKLIELMSFIRFCLIDDPVKLKILIDNLEHECCRVNFLFNLGSLSKSNEEQTLIFLRNLCEKHLEIYETTMEEDKVILNNAKASGLGENERNCIKLRLGEKEVLHEIIKFCNSCLKLFDYQINLIEIGSVVGR